MLHEVGQQIEDPRLHRDEHPGPPELIARGVQSVVAKAIAHARLLGHCPSRVQAPPSLGLPRRQRGPLNALCHKRPPSCAAPLWSHCRYHGLTAWECTPQNIPLTSIEIVILHA